MTISIPVAQFLGSTDVLDVTDTFDNTLQMTYPLDLKLQYDGGIYQNVIETLEVPTYTATPPDPYNIGDTVYVGTYPNGLVSRITATGGTVPTQPIDYITTLDEGFDETTWSTAYSRLIDIPATYRGDNEQISASASKAFVFNSTGTKAISAGYVITSGGSVNPIFYNWSFSTGFDLTTATKGSYAYPIAGSPAIDVSSDGTQLYCVGTDNGMSQEDLSVAWDCSSTRTLVKLRSDITGSRVTFNPTGTYMWVADGTNIKYYALSIAWSLNSASYLFTQPLGPDSAATICGITFNNAGTRAYIGRQYDAMYQYDLSVAFNPASMTLTGRNDSTQLMGSQCEELILRGNDAGNDLFFRSGYGSIVRVYMSTTNDVEVMFKERMPVEASIKDGNYWHTFKLESTGVGTYQSTSKILTLLGTELVSATVEAHVYSSLDNNSQVLKAYQIQELTDYTTSWNGRTFVMDGENVFVRTDQDVAVETIPVTDYEYATIISPAELDGFEYLEATNDQKPFDNKNYSSAITENGSMFYLMQGETQFDTVALGNVKADHVNIAFYDSQGQLVAQIDTDINTARDSHNHLEDWYTTLVFYSSADGSVANATLMEEGSSVAINLTSSIGKSIELATLMLGISAEAGFTNLTLKNDYKDYSVYEYNEFGTDYVERAKVSRYSGTADMLIENYDMTDRLMTSLGKNLVIVNGSDSGSENADSLTIFSATQKIGRFINFNQLTKISDNDMDVMATYSFTLEEIV